MQHCRRPLACELQTLQHALLLFVKALTSGCHMGTQKVSSCCWLAVLFSTVPFAAAGSGAGARAGVSTWPAAPPNKDRRHSAAAQSVRCCRAMADLHMRAAVAAAAACRCWDGRRWAAPPGLPNRVSAQGFRLQLLPVL